MLNRVTEHCLVLDNLYVRSLQIHQGRPKTNCRRCARTAQVQATRFRALLLADGNVVYSMLEDLAGLCKPDGNARVRENARAALTAVLKAVRSLLTVLNTV